VVTVSFSIEGDKQVERELLRLAKAPDMRRIAPELGDYLRNVERSQFDSEGRTGSGGWTPLKPKTVASKAARGLDPRILRAHERLRKSLTNKRSADAVFNYDADSLFFGTRVPYARHHQFGAPRANVPRRKLIDMSERNRRRVVKIVQAGIMNEIRG
jgi:phage gpG-like protein